MHHLTLYLTLYLPACCTLDHRPEHRPEQNLGEKLRALTEEACQRTCQSLAIEDSTACVSVYQVNLTANQLILAIAGIPEYWRSDAPLSTLECALFDWDHPSGLPNQIEHITGGSCVLALRSPGNVDHPTRLYTLENGDYTHYSLGSELLTSGIYDDQITACGHARMQQLLRELGQKLARFELHKIDLSDLMTARFGPNPDSEHSYLEEWLSNEGSGLLERYREPQALTT